MIGELYVLPYGSVVWTESSLCRQKNLVHSPLMAIDFLATARLLDTRINIIVDGGRIIMFQALFFQERDAKRDLVAHKNELLKSRESPIGVRMECPDATIKKESTESPKRRSI